MQGLLCGRFRITQLLGSGGMAEVWVAKHELIEQYAAVKLLMPHVATQEQLVKRFLQEAKAAAAIDHPSIVQVLDVGHTADGQAYIAMELLRGETLTQRLQQRGQLSIGEACRVARQIAGAMRAAHDRGIVHRDLKPDNLFLVADPEVVGGERIKVLDFGLAKLASELQHSVMTAAGTIFGTPAYMAPEQCMDSGKVDGRADLYSIGCIMYRCLSGRAPFEHPDAYMILRAHLKETPAALRALRADIPVALDALIMRLLAKNPAERVSSCTALLDALDAVAPSEPGLDTSALKTILDDPPSFEQSDADNAVTLIVMDGGSRPPPHTPWIVSPTPHADLGPRLTSMSAGAGQMVHGGEPRAALLGGRPGPRRRRLVLLVGAIGTIAALAFVAWMREPDRMDAADTDADVANEPLDIVFDEDPGALDDAGPTGEMEPVSAESITDAGMPDTRVVDAAPEPDARPRPSNETLEGWLRQASQAFSQDEYARAGKLCRRVLSYVPRQPVASQICAMVACVQGNAARARRYLAAVDDPAAATALVRYCRTRDIEVRAP